MTLASQPVFSLASVTVSNTGRPRWMLPPLPGEVPPTILVPYAMAASEWKVPFLPVKPWQMTLVFLSIRMDMRSAFAKLTSERSVDAAVDAGEHVGPALRVRRELDLQRIGIVVDDFIDVARIAAERAAHQRQGLADPPTGGGRGRRVAERIVPEQFVGPVFAVEGEDAVGGEALLAVAGLDRVLDQVEAIEIHVGHDARSRRPALRPARRKDHLFAIPFTGERGKTRVLRQRG